MRDSIQGRNPDPFDYKLNSERIAQRPIEPYDRARLLQADRNGNAVVDGYFFDLPKLVSSQDLFVFNDSKVIPARLFGMTAGGREFELLLLEELLNGNWRCIGKPLKKIADGDKILFKDGLSCDVVKRDKDGTVEVQFYSQSNNVREKVLAQGVMPIPPYIRGGRADEKDFIDYQSIFAATEGSVAAPTASLHFTRELMDALAQRGCQFGTLTLHVGRASFRSVWDEGGGFHPPEPERLSVRSELLEQIQSHRQKGGRVIAVGTTVVRALESLARDRFNREGVSKSADIFIQPPFDFRLCDAIITNFHQPKSSHLLLVEAFLGRERLAEVYKHALSNDYRFLSYGDGMLLT